MSHDNGITWEPHSTVIRYDQHFGGVYEPIFVEIDGLSTVFYANDTVQQEGETIGIGIEGETHQPAVPTLHYQNIEFMQWIDSEWDSRTVACSGVISRSHDGMPGLTQLADGRWLLAFEASNTGEWCPFVLRYKLSDDGLRWNTNAGTENETVCFVILPPKTARPLVQL